MAIVAQETIFCQRDFWGSRDEDNIYRRDGRAAGNDLASVMPGLARA
jgi:hypothetical protein